MIRLFTFLLVLVVSCTASHAQYLGFASLFRPGARVGVQYMPSTIGENEGSFGYSQLRSTLILPLGGGANIDLKKLKASGTQQFLTLNFGARQLELADFSEKKEIANFSAGFTGISASTSAGIWVYSVHGGFIQDFQTNTNTPFAMAGAMKIKVKGLNKQNFFGGGLVYSGKRLLPVPLIGLRRKLAKKLHFTVLFPVQLDLTKKISKRLRLSWLNAVSGFSSQLNYQVGLNDQSALFNFGAFRSSLIFQWKLSKNFKLFVEGGLNTFGQIQVFDTARDTRYLDYPAHFTPYAGLTARFNFGKSLVGSQLFGNDL